MDSKDRYSEGVKTQNTLSKENEVLHAAIERSRERKRLYGANWEAVNINDIMARFAPNAVPYERGVKIHWHSPTTGYDVVADISGYLRIQDLNPGPYKGTYLDINGNHIKDMPHLAGEDEAAYHERLMRISHFRILKREEMK